MSKSEAQMWAVKRADGTFTTCMGDNGLDSATQKWEQWTGRKWSYYFDLGYRCVRVGIREL